MAKSVDIEAFRAAVVAAGAKEDVSGLTLTPAASKIRVGGHVWSEADRTVALAVAAKLDPSMAVVDDIEVAAAFVPAASLDVEFLCVAAVPGGMAGQRISCYR